MFERSKQGAVDVIRGNDPLTDEFVAELRSLLERNQDSRQPHVVIDLEKIPMIDSTGLELLLEFQDRFTERGGALKLAAANPLCRDILRITNVSNRMAVFDNVISAVGSFTQ